jgi:hypothetical protein
MIRNSEHLLPLNKELHLTRIAARSVSQPILSAGINRLEEGMDLLVVLQLIGIVSLSRCLFGDLS